MRPGEFRKVDAVETETEASRAERRLSLRWYGVMFVGFTALAAGVAVFMLTDPGFRVNPRRLAPDELLPGVGMLVYAGIMLGASVFFFRRANRI